jgi:hypothetical protein
MVARAAAVASVRPAGAGPIVPRTVVGTGRSEARGAPGDGEAEGPAVVDAVVAGAGDGVAAELPHAATTREIARPKAAGSSSLRVARTWLVTGQ